MSRLLVALGALATLSLAAPSRGQDSVAPPQATPRRVDGRVVIVRAAATTPLGDTWVTLHRVASDGAGPLDSVRTDARGRYAFRYRTSGAGDALYFTSTRYGGVAYFTAPLRGAAVAGETAEISVFDTTSARVPTTVRGRHLVIAAPTADGRRNVIEVYEISNDSSVTIVERAGATSGTWSTSVPGEAKELQVREGEVSPDALTFASGRATLRIPLAPGLKQVAFSYVLDAGAFPLDVAADQPATVLEVLLEDDGGTASGGGLVSVEPVTVEGRPFRRFLAQDVRSGSRIRIDLPAPRPPWTRLVVPALLGVVGLGMVGALVWPRRRGAARARGQRSTPRAQRLPYVPPLVERTASDEEAQLAREIAALDDAFARDVAPSADARRAYDARRAELKARLTDLLARSGTAV